MPEIARLKPEAGFINLSACETGLGRVCCGEGVIGLTQAFLMAGAEGVSVSLWKVADEAPARFMSGMYARAHSQSLGYAEALTELKRAFLRGDFGASYRDPYYWAPFVYYCR